jgi:hypothetical protein
MNITGSRFPRENSPDRANALLSSPSPPAAFMSYSPHCLVCPPLTSRGPCHQILHGHLVTLSVFLTISKLHYLCQSYLSSHFITNIQRYKNKTLFLIYVSTYYRNSVKILPTAGRRFFIYICLINKIIYFYVSLVELIKIFDLI